MRISRNIAITLICIILGAMLAWQYRSINYNQTLASTQSRRTEDLMAELIKLQNSNNELTKRLQQLQEDNRALENERVGSNEVAQMFKQNLENTRIFAGLTDVKGRGVIITLENNGIVTVLGEDLLNVVNELRAAGAQAISINEERVVAMTEIRDTGNYIVINGVKMNSPFRIKAISDPDSLERSLKMLGGTLENLESVDLKVSLTKSDNITIPKLRSDATAQRFDLLKPVQ